MPQIRWVEKMKLLTRKEIEAVNESIDRVRLDNDVKSDENSKSRGGEMRQYMNIVDPPKDCDIFLSHSSSETALVKKVTIKLNRLGFSVYVDSLDVSLNSCDNVDDDVVLKLQEEMSNCKVLLYLHTKNSSKSKWCPWELGFFDGSKGKNRTYVFPITEDGFECSPESLFDQQEYLLIYPVVGVGSLKESKGSRDQLRGGYFGSHSSKNWSISSLCK